MVEDSISVWILFSSGNWARTNDLQGMNLASCHCSTPHRVREQRYPSFRSASTPSSLTVGCSGPILCCCYNIIRLRCRRGADTLRLLGDTFLFQPNLTLLGSNGWNIRISFICRSRRCARRTGEIISLNSGRFSKVIFEAKGSILIFPARSTYAVCPCLFNAIRP